MSAFEYLTHKGYTISNMNPTVVTFVTTVNRIFKMPSERHVELAVATYNVSLSFAIVIGS